MFIEIKKTILHIILMNTFFFNLIKKIIFISKILNELQCNDSKQMKFLELYYILIKILVIISL